jgi:hypothetical protein
VGGVDWIRLARDMGPVAGSYEHGNELSALIKGGICFCLEERLSAS